MISPKLTGPAPGQPPSSPLFEAFAFPPDAYCEAFSSTATPRPHWQPIIAALAGMGHRVLGNRQDRVRRMRHEDGATFNPFDDPTGRATPWALDVMPLLVTTAEWEALEAGLIQRAHLLEQILADTYGPQRLLKEGQIPPELVFANRHFLRTCHDIQPTGKRFLTFYAADLYRDAQGRFRVLRDYGANPSGLGYALENRIVISRVFPELYHKTQILRLAPFFQAFHQATIQRSALQKEETGIVLLTPGPESPIYFEHAFLSRYLGYPLVEGQDLTVRNGKVFLKKLAGLEPVETIFRHTGDADSDPFALRRGATPGVAGLIQASREQSVDVVNPIGSGFADTPALAVFLPSLSRQLTGEDLLLENHPSWWCGRPDGLSHVCANLEQLSVGPALDPVVTLDRKPDLKTAIETSPHAFMAREPVWPATAPAWRQNGVEAAYVIMRIFACATEGGFTVMPGGLAVTATDVGTLMGGLPEEQQSKDIWVLSDQPVVPFSLMGGLRTVEEFSRGSDLPSRVADHLLWLGRYLERAEGLVRRLRSVFRRLSGEARPGDIPELPFLLNLLASENTIPEMPEEGEGFPRYRELAAHLKEALFRQDRPASVMAILARVREAARNVRDRLSLDSWRVINRLEEFAEAQAADPLELLDDTLFSLSAFSGLAMESMTRGLGWRFMDMGRRVERAINQTSLLRIGLPRVCTESRSALEALLEISDSIMTYRSRYRTAFQLAPVLDLLLADETNPKSLAFQLSRLTAHVENLPARSGRRFAAPEERLALEMLTAVRLLDLTDIACPNGRGPRAELARFLEDMENRLSQFSREISAHYLSRVPATPHFSMALDGREP
jgi:uncharacterized circularly permuted ATP-grasp superfamily protein/uncharacterized alpha-E superfamily protein